MNYVSLHNHTYFSPLDGYSSPEEYLKRARSLGMNAFAITEHGNVYSWIYFAKLQKEYPEIKVLYGVELYEAFDASEKDKENKYFHLLAIAKNERGRVALNTLVTRSNLEGFYYKPRVDLEMMKPYANDIIITSACLASKISRAEDYATALEYAKEYADIFPHFYLEMQSHRHPDQVAYNQRLLEIYHSTGIPFIIATDSHSATEDELEYQNMLTKVSSDDDDGSIYEGCYLQSIDEIHTIMDEQIGFHYVEEGLYQTNLLADLVEDVQMPFQEPTLPHYPLPDGFESNEEYLKHLVYEGGARMGMNVPENYFNSEEEYKIYMDRIEYELDVINNMGFAGYFIIVWDIINWSNENGVMVGAGRGSAGGSLVCYLLGITQLDPIKYGLIFERFLNPERVSMPDIDIDFSDRDKVVQYLIEKYGEDKVCQIINYSYITPKVAIKDACRILDIPYNVSETLAKASDIKSLEELITDFPEYKNAILLALKFVGRVRNVSTHAGGVGIVDTNVNEYMAMKLGAKNEHVIQVDKRTSEDIGIIKFDILGISTLTMVKEILNDLNLDYWEINPNNDEFLYNKPMWNVLKTSRTMGVFQVESQGMRDLLLRLEPNNLDEVSAVLALYRPDSMDMLEDYIHNRNNPEDIKIWHPSMESIVRHTYGTIIFQEQLMEIVRLFGGRSMGGADLFRKAIGKKDFALVKREADTLRKEIVENGYSEELANTIGEYMETKGGYMFNASHSALYAVLTLQTAYLKANYPEYFFKALLNQNIGDFASINKYIVDARSFGVNVLPPNISKSIQNFSVHGKDILFGIGAIKGIGDTLSEKIIVERTEGGKFLNFENFVERVNPSVSQVVALIKSGAIPCDNKRKYLKGYATSLYPMREYKEVKTLPSKKVLEEKWNISFSDDFSKEEKLLLYNDYKKKLFEMEQKESQLKKLNGFSEKYLSDEMLWEFETLSIFLSNNPFKKAERFITSHENISDGDKCVLVGVIADVYKKKDRHGKMFSFVNLYTSMSEILDITFWHSQYKEYSEEIKKGNKIAVLCRKQDGNRFVVEKLKPYDVWITQREDK